MNLNATLTKRQSQMITGIVLGKCKKEIAAELSISPRTAENTVRTAMERLDVRKSTDLVVYWFVKHFSIPVEELPKSITAMIFLLIWLPSEFSPIKSQLRSMREKEIEERICGSCRRNKEDFLTLEF
jgi:DNA-binding CsgD family transcriptional regulator